MRCSGTGNQRNVPGPGKPESSGACHHCEACPAWRQPEVNKELVEQGRVVSERGGGKKDREEGREKP